MIRRSRSAIVALSIAAAATTACSAGTDFERSCDGEAVPNCRPYEASELTAFSVEPSSLRLYVLQDPFTVHARFRQCGSHRPGNVGVHVGVIYSDGMAGMRETPLLDVRDDGTAGDASAGDGRIDQTVGNPFTDPIAAGPATLRGESFIGTCTSDPIEVDFLVEPAPPPRM